MRFSDRYLCFDPEGPDGRRRALLWPVYVWHVMYPVPTRQELNVFQTTILRLARAGCVSTTEQAKLMGLSKDLVAFIVEKELTSRMLVDSSGRPTADGIAALVGAEVSDQAMRIGYSFQDAVTGLLMPRFAPTLPEIEAEGDSSEKWPSFVTSRETGHDIHPFCVTPKRKHPGPTTPRLLEAYEAYRFHHRQRELGDEVDSAATASRLYIRSVEALGTEPQPMFLLTWIQPDETEEWQVRDPFLVLEHAPWLRRSVDEAIRGSEALGRTVASVLGSGMRGATAENQPDRLASQVGLEMMSRPWVAAAPDVAVQMELVLRRRYQVSYADTPLPEDLNSLAIETQKLGEAVFQWYLKKYPADRRRLSVRGDLSKSSLASWQKFCGDHGLPCLTEGAVRRLGQQKWADIEGALRNGRKSLKALAAASLFSTIDHSDHPFRWLTSAELSIERLFQLADDRNAAGHYSSGRPIAPSAVCEAATFVVDWTDRLIEAGRIR